MRHKAGLLASSIYVNSVRDAAVGDTEGDLWGCCSPACSRSGTGPQPVPYEVTGAGRIWYLVNHQTRTVWLIHAGPGHSKATTGNGPAAYDRPVPGTAGCRQRGSAGTGRSSGEQQVRGRSAGGMVPSRRTFRTSPSGSVRRPRSAGTGRGSPRAARRTGTPTGRGLNGAFVVATPPDGDDLAYLDNQLQGTIVERAADVLSLRETWESVRAEALSHGQTIKMISEAAEAWT
jgi:hypothetical protein